MESPLAIFAVHWDHEPVRGTLLVWSPAFRRSGPAKAGTPKCRFMGLDQLVNIGVARNFPKAEVAAANGFIERLLAGQNEGGGRDEGEAAFGERLFPRRPGD